jgi:chloramphenicol 3-O phosphotransferase
LLASGGSLPDSAVMAIIFLNGCTSAGKTTLARALQHRLPGVWLHIGIDVGIAMLAERYFDHPDGLWFDKDAQGLVRLNFGFAALTALAAYRRGAAAIAATGVDLIIDEVLIPSDFLADWQAVLPDVPLLMVGVHCDLVELERREAARGDRVIGQARGQLGQVHAHIVYDLEVDTGASSIEACAEAIAARITIL